ncbi:MAG TPA: CopD family protein [Kofleriaceae bacterium]|nr:CopD family protein [Kofleriaceae bacterium]
MSSPTYEWVLAAHLLGLVFWIAGMFSVYWLLRVHAQAPKDATAPLMPMERSMALMMDIAAAVAIGCGLVLAIKARDSMPKSWFGYGAWLHVKLAIVAVGLLPVHGLLRARIKKFSTGKIAPIPGWVWTLLLISVTAIVIVATTKLQSLR